MGLGLPPSDFAVVWSSVEQDGAKAAGVIPGASNSMPKTGLDLVVDEPTGTLVVLWREENFVLNKIRLAIARSGVWTLTNLLPNVGFPHAYNPQMLLTHQTVHWRDENDKDVYANRSVLSVIWWEEAVLAQARYASIFLDETIDPSQVEVYDLPELVNDPGPTSLENLSSGAYAFPSLQSEGPGGAVLASFAALSSKKHYVVRVTYPTELGKPSIDNITWQRRRIPVVGIASEAPIAAIPTFGAASVSTVIGSSYRPDAPLARRPRAALRPLRRHRLVRRPLDRLQRRDDLRQGGRARRGDGAEKLVSGIADPSSVPTIPFPRVPSAGPSAPVPS